MTALHPASPQTVRTHTKVLFVDLSLEFNTVIPEFLPPQAHCASLHLLVDHKLLDRKRRQQVRQQKITSSTGTPQGCVLSSLLFFLYTNECTSGNLSVKLLQFADNTTIIGFIWDGDVSAYRLGGGEQPGAEHHVFDTSCF